MQTTDSGMQAVGGKKNQRKQQDYIQKILYECHSEQGMRIHQEKWWQ